MSTLKYFLLGFQGLSEKNLSAAVLVIVGGQTRVLVLKLVIVQL